MEQINMLQQIGKRINEFLSSISGKQIEVINNGDKKVNKDPNRPKKPADILAVYINDQKKLRPEQFQNLTKKQSNQNLAKQWQGVAEGIKQKYRKMYQKQMQKYRQHLKKQRKQRQQKEQKQI